MRSLLIETLASMLNAFLLPVYTLKVDLDSLASHFTLPAAKIILRYLLLNNTECLAESSFQRRMQIWPSLCKLLNELKDTTPSGLVISLISICILQKKTSNTCRPVDGDYLEDYLSLKKSRT